jgi:nucleoid DNA-binding protein
MTITGRLVDTVLEHLGVTKEQVERVKTIIDMVEFKVEDGKKIATIQLGEGIEVTIVQPDKPLD